MMNSRRRLFDFHAATLEALGNCTPPVKTPIAIQDGFGGLRGAAAISKLFSMVPTSAFARRQLKEWSSQNRLILSFHYYPSNDWFGVSNMELLPFIALAKKEAQKYYSNCPLWLSEFWCPSEQETAEFMTDVLDSGMDAVTYWHYCNLNFTGQPGWYRYPESVTRHGLLFEDGAPSDELWQAYAKTIEDGNVWGGFICGAGGGKCDVLARLGRCGCDGGDHDDRGIRPSRLKWKGVAMHPSQWKAKKAEAASTNIS